MLLVSMPQHTLYILSKTHPTDKEAQPVFCMPAAIPFIVKIRVSSRPGAYSLLGLSLTSSAAGLLDSM